MNLSEIFDKQKKLDKTILERSQHLLSNLTIEERNKLSKISLIVEMGEFMNEIESFKYWKKNKKNNKDNIKEEFADVLHFIISWAVIKDIDPIIEPKIINNDVNDQYIEIMKSLVLLFDNDNKENVTNSLSLILGLSKLVGLTPQEIKESYLVKNKINWERMQNNY
ncbi:dUTP diphosphatase [Mycoplasma elephantis]|uniref:dUTP diphosphatase n=1 Tax=Mycoplasma elephantis TaxID=114882 RepID=UPI00047F2928|nr:dUTP diphosphatase [Mycoplasma elephantis]